MEHSEELPISSPSLSREAQLQRRKLMREYWAAQKRKQRKTTVNFVTESNTGEMDERKKRRICQSMVQHFDTLTVGMDASARKEIFDELLQHPCFLTMQSKSKELEAFMLRNIRNTLNHVKVPRSSDEFFVKKSAMLMLVNGESKEQNTDMSIPQAAKLMGIHKRNLYSAKHHLTVASESDGSFPASACHRDDARRTHITQTVKDIVFQFWMDETRVSPNKKDVCSKRLARCSYVKHPIHLLEEPQVELYLRFKRKYADIQISQRCFESMKPFFVRKLRDRYTCCCIVHVQMIFLKEAVNHMRTQSFDFHGSCCMCSCPICLHHDEVVNHGCLASKNASMSTTSLLESILCPIPAEHTFHSYQCLMGTCNACGVGNIQICPREEVEQSKQVSVKFFENIVGATELENEARKSTVKDIVHKKMLPRELLRVYQDHLKKYVIHNFIFRWQAQQFKDCISLFPDDVVVSVVDFAENYSFKEQNEIQSMHWYTKQVTIFVLITYFRIASGAIKKTMHFFVSDDKQHDTLFVQHAFLLHAQWLRDQGLSFKKHWVWSDGAASQFKAKRPFYFVARYWSLTGMEMNWNFFCSGHGKGEHDGAGAVIKRALTHEQLKQNSVRLTCAVEVVAFLRMHLSTGATAMYDKQKREVSRVFWEVKLGDVQRSHQWDCKPLKGSRAMHCVNGYSENNTCALRSKRLSCFCFPCRLGHWRRCINRSHVETWLYHTLEPLANDSQSSGDSDDEEFNGATYAGHYDSLSDALTPGDNFAVTSEENNEEAIDFYILKCVVAKDLTTNEQIDAWGNKIEKHTYMVTGHWYKSLQANLYELWDNKPVVFIYSHLIRAIKFPMEPVVLDGIGEVFELSNENHEAIYNSMPFEL